MSQSAALLEAPTHAHASVLGVRPSAVPGLDDEAVVRLLGEVEALGRRVDALRVALAGEVAERSRRELGRDGLAAGLGRNAMELVQRVTGASGVAVNRRIRLGRATRAAVSITGESLRPVFGQVAAGLEDGVLGLDAASAIVDTLSPALRVTAAERVRVAEAGLVAGAVAADPSGAPPWDADSVRVQATVWHAVLDPDGAAPSERDAERRGLRLLAPRYGLIPVAGMLMPEVAGALAQYADACTNPRTAELANPQASAGPDAAAVGEPTAGDAAGGAGGGAVGGGAGGVTGADQASGVTGADQRSRAQQLHDVLAAIIGVAARVADAPSVAGNAPTLVVSVNAADLVSGKGVGFVDGVPPVSINTARHVGCAGAVQRVVVGGNGRIVGIGSPERCFTGAQRRAIALRDGGCVIPGCHVPVGWCEVHHVVPHAYDPDGTDTDNGVLVCWHHHRTLDTSGWQIRIRDGLPQIKAPPWIDHSGKWWPAVGSPVRIAAARTAAA
jgi:5-methylcytosine-specific restriction protein A